MAFIYTKSNVKNTAIFTSDRTYRHRQMYRITLNHLIRTTFYENRDRLLSNLRRKWSSSNRIGNRHWPIKGMRYTLLPTTNQSDWILLSHQLAFS